MFKYVTDVSELSHNIIKEFCCNFEVAVDATLGNGHDTNFLAEIFKKVYAFDIQSQCIENYSKKNINNVTLIEDSHHKINEYVKGNIDCAIYNLGFLPGGDKNITTLYQNTIVSIKTSLELLNPGGIVSIAIYVGHEEGKKEEAIILEFVKTLPKNQYGVLLHSFINRTNNPPMLLIIEKK